MKRIVVLVAAIAALVVLFAAWIGSDRAAAQRVFDKYSVENTSDDGFSLAFRYLQRTGHRAARLDHTLAPRAAAANGVVFRFGTIVQPLVFEEEEDEDDDKDKKATKADPKKKPEPKKKPAEMPKRISPLLTPEEEAWVRGGGRLVMGVSEGGIERHDIQAKSADKVFPLWPGLDKIALPEGSAFLGTAVPAHMVTLYAAANEPVIVRQTIGAGDVIAIAAPAIFRNAALRHGNHLELLAALAGKRPVYFDETIHGLGAAEGALDLLESWGLGPFLLLALATALLVFWRRAKRVGAPEYDDRDVRSDAVDLVASLGALYRKSMTDAEALGLYRDTLTRTVAANTGLRGDALHRRVSALTRGRTPAGDAKLSAAAMRRHLEAINEGFRSMEGRRRKRAAGETHADSR